MYAHLFPLSDYAFYRTECQHLRRNFFPITRSNLTMTYNYSQRISLQDTSNKILKSHTLDSKERSILRFSEETLTLLL